jgi:ADP-ribose pyrophosphatase YjhB (NUDIX family)
LRPPDQIVQLLHLRVAVIDVERTPPAEKCDILGAVAETVVCVGAVVLDGDRVLLVRQSPGHSLAGQWTIPWGRLEPGESPMAAAVRETLEEGGIASTVQGLLGVQELPAPWEGWLALIYLCRPAASDVAAPTGSSPNPQDPEADAAAYLSLAEVAEWPEPIEPLSAWLARRVLAGRFTVTPADATNPLQSDGSFL